MTLDDAAFPALDLVRPTLAKYGLRPPNEDASAPVTATLVGTDWGLLLRDVTLDLRGASVRGQIGLSRGGILEGRAQVTLEEEYLRTSKILTLPRVLTERLVVPVRVDGPMDHPHVHAELAQCLGRFLKDNRVRQLVTSAAHEAQALLGRPPAAQPVTEPPRVPIERELASELDAIVEAHAADWSELARRRGG